VKHLVLTITLLAPLAVFAADSKSEPPSGASAAFNQIKSLVGEWQADTPMGKARISYELVAAGSAILERETIADHPPMITMYYLDGGRLLLTHYCMVGNQPRMQAKNYDPATHELKFQFLDITNLASASAAHMHNGTFWFVDDQHFKASWDYYVDGKAKDAHAFEYTRVR
jgi:hypothetical protein